MAHLQHLKANEILVSRKHAVVVYLERINKLMIEDVQTLSVPLIRKTKDKGLLTEVTVESDLAFLKTDEEDKDIYRMQSAICIRLRCELVN